MNNCKILLIVLIFTITSCANPGEDEQFLPELVHDKVMVETDSTHTAVPVTPGVEVSITDWKKTNKDKL